MEFEEKDTINDIDDEIISGSSQEIDSALEKNEVEQKIKDLEKEIVELKTQHELSHDRLLRATAEGENIRRIAEKNIAEAKDYSVVNITKDLIVVMDNLKRALDHKPNDLDEKSANIYAGVEMTKSELESIFKKHGLETLNPQVGEKFDYNIHEAVAQIVTDDYKQDSIVSVMQPGYKIKDRLLRAAMVTVSKKS